MHKQLTALVTGFVVLAAPANTIGAVGQVAAGMMSAAATSATIAPSLSADRLGARASLTVTIRYSGGVFGVPLPVRRSVVLLPAGMSLDVPSLRACSAGRLRARGAAGCPAVSRLGGGHALVQTRSGSQAISEDVALNAFLGPPENLQPTFEILARGYTPLEKRVVFEGSVRSGAPPYGEELVMSIPPVSTLPLEPDASILTFSLTVGAPGSGQRASAVLVPSSCPSGGFPFAAWFTYADGSHGGATARIPCP